jgi:hypothetical protein
MIEGNKYVRDRAGVKRTGHRASMQSGLLALLWADPAWDPLGCPRSTSKNPGASTSSIEISGRFGPRHAGAQIGPGIPEPPNSPRSQISNLPLDPVHKRGTGLYLISLSLLLDQARRSADAEHGRGTGTGTGTGWLLVHDVSTGQKRFPEHNGLLRRGLLC